MEENTLNDLLRIKAGLIESLLTKGLSPEEIRFVLNKAVETSEEAYDATIKSDNQFLATLMARYADKKGVNLTELFKRLGLWEEENELEE